MNAIEKQEELGNVYLKIEGLDKERFKKLIEGMCFWGVGGINKRLSNGNLYVENYVGSGNFKWLSNSMPESDAELITLDELEERLNPFVLPENWCIRGGKEFETLCEKLEGLQGIGCDIGGRFDDLFYYKMDKNVNSREWDWGQYSPKGRTEITVEQFEKYILNPYLEKQNKETFMKNKTRVTVTRQALAEILPHVCTDYKTVINRLAQKDLFSNEIEIHQELISQAYKDASKDIQKDWLAKYLPKPKKKVIELTHCLQTTGNWYKSSCFYLKDTMTYKKAYRILHDRLEYDVIITESKDGDINIFLGHWNDGIIPTEED